MVLQQYLILTGEEQFPMLIPQPAILKGKRRPDFVCFVPVSKYQFQKVVVLVDRPGKDSDQAQQENKEYASEGFRVRRILVDPSDRSSSYFKLARELVLWLDASTT